MLVNGGTGAIGSAAVQLLANLGVRVTAVCDTAHVELVRGLGADKVVDYTVEDFTDDDLRYDIVFDACGKSSFGRCRRLLKPGGIYVSSDGGPWFPERRPAARDAARGAVPGPQEGRLSLSQASIRRWCGGSPSSWSPAAFRPVIDRRYPLDDIVEAYRYVETGRKIGSVVITVDHTS